MEIRYIDLFGGIGGFRLGIERADKISIDSEQGIGKEERPNIPCSQRSGGNIGKFHCVWYNDIDKYATQIYNKRFEESYSPKDIRDVDVRDIPKHDLICSGFPCQSFSIAGKRKGFEDTRGTLFFEICRIAEFHRPKYLFLENVKGILSSDEGRTFATILESLWELGYDVEWQVLNSKDFGVPQNRERVFIIGHLGGFGGGQVFPLREDGKISEGKNESKKERSQTEYSKALKGVEMKADNTFAADFRYDEGLRPRENGTPCLFDQSKGGGLSNDLFVIQDCFDSLHGFGHGWQGYHNRKAINKGMIRRLTPIECERLQGFPDGWTKGISDTQRYKLLGNAVTVNVIESIIKKFKLREETGRIL